MIVVRRRFDHLTGVPRVLAHGILVTCGVVGAALLPGMLGILAPGTVVATAFLILLAATRVPALPGAAPEPDPDPEPDSDRVAWLLAGAAVWVVATYAIAQFVFSADTPLMAFDQVTFKLPALERWIQSGSFWQIDLFLPRQRTGSYPQNGDLVLLTMILPWNNDAFVRLTDYPFAVMAGLSVYAGAVELRAPKAIAVVAGALFVSLPVVSVIAFANALPDTIMVATFASGLVFLIRHLRTGRRSDLVLAGLGLGLGMGSKWYGVEAVPLLLIVWAGGWLVARVPWRRVAGDLAVLAGCIAATTGFWFIRNWVEFGNPAYPAKFLFFHSPPDAHRDVFGLSISQYFDDGGAIRHHILPGIGTMLSAGGVLVGIGLIVGAVIAARRPADARGRLVRQAVLALAAFAVLMSVIYVFTPYSAQGFNHVPDLTAVNVRWILPGLAAAGFVAAWAGGWSRRMQIPVALAGAASAFISIRHGLVPPHTTLGLVAVGVGAVMAAALAVRSGRLPRPGRTSALAAAGLLLVGIVAGGQALQRDFNDGRYLGQDPTFDWVLQRDQRFSIGIAGNWSGGGQPEWPMFGEDLENRVSYVGEIVRGDLVPFKTAAEFSGALRDRGYDLVLVGNAPQISDPSQEPLWARRDPALRPVAKSRFFTLYAVKKA